MRFFNTDKPFFKSRKFVVLFLTIVFYIINAILLRNKLPGIPIEYTYGLIAAIVGWMASEGYVDGKREESKAGSSPVTIDEDKLTMKAGTKIAEATEKLIEGKKE